MIRDILSEIAMGKISIDEADRLYETIINSNQSSNIRELMGLSKTEWTAFSHGVTFSELSKWRVFGWPDSCPVCRKKIVPDNFGWIAKESTRGGHYLIHVNCIS